MGPYASANLADHVGDDPAAVRENRARLAAATGLGDPGRWWFLDQVHGARTLLVDGARAPAGPVPAADAVVTAHPGVVLVVLTADCAPVAIADDAAVGAVHVGWRGLLAGVVAEAVATLRRAGSGPVAAAIGPCIRPAAYEFGRAGLDRLVDRFGPAVEGCTGTGRPALDLAAGVRAALAECGVTAVEDLGADTAGDPERYFSHRRDGATGRQAMLVVRERAQ